MTEFSFNIEDLQPNSPRVLPAPLEVGIVFCRAGSPLDNSVAEALEQADFDTDNTPNLWVVGVWDPRLGSDPIAFGAYAYDQTSPIKMAGHMHEGYSCINLSEYLDCVGYGLWHGVAAI